MEKTCVSIVLIAISFFCKAQSWDSLGGGMEPLFYDVAVDVKSFTTYNGNLIAGGDFVKPGNNIASWNGTTWSALGSGIKYNEFNDVEALAVYNGTLIAGGHFDSAGGIRANFMAKWDGTSWFAFNGVNQQVKALIVYNSNLVAGGDFDTVAGVKTNYIAEWNGSSWSSLGSGTNGGVNAFTIYNGNLITAGYFDSAGGSPANNIAQWNGTSWSSLGNGTNATINALAVYNGNLYAGGYFDSAGGNLAYYIAEWNGTSWSALGAGMGGGNYTAVFSLDVYNNNLIAGGEFDSAGGIAGNNVAQWNGMAWSVLGSGMHQPRFPPTVYSLNNYNGNLIAGGFFDSAGGERVNNIAEWCPTCTAGINALTYNVRVNVFPNPGNGKFTFQCSGVSDQCIVEVFNLLGEKVYSTNYALLTSYYSLDLSSQPNGIYFYRILNETGNLIFEGKLVIQK